MKKRISLILTVVSLSFLLTACGKFTCELCGQEKSGKSYSVEFMGEKATACQDCHDEIKKLQKKMQDMFN